MAASLNELNIAVPRQQGLDSGAHNANPPGLGLAALLAEDFRTYDRNLLDPALWAVLTHRFGNWRMGLRPKPLRAPFSALYALLHLLCSWLWGIDLPYNVKLGRRVRIWHHGAMFLCARIIGDDVHIRHSTTFGVKSVLENGQPVIENGVDIGCGVCILGDITVGEGSVIGANSVVIKDVPPRSTVIGVPARIQQLAPPKRIA